MLGTKVVLSEMGLAATSYSVTVVVVVAERGCGAGATSETPQRVIAAAGELFEPDCDTLALRRRGRFALLFSEGILGTVQEISAIGPPRALEPKAR